MTQIEQYRQFFARSMCAASGGKFTQLEDAVAIVPREKFLGPGPWQIFINGQYLTTPNDNPIFVYNNYLIALDAEKGINNGESFLHANWITGLALQAGDIVCHVGAGTGYYSALLAHLVANEGQVLAFEVEPDLAQKASRNLSSYAHVSVHATDAVDTILPEADVIYVNAGVPAPPAHWLRALRTNGRLIFPWRPAENVGVALIATRTQNGFAVAPLMRSLFIPCVGVTSTALGPATINPFDAWRVRSIQLSEEANPDETAIAVFDYVWFSHQPPQ